ncbi:hypothetical protein vseg_016543 [Gypsophila vaccaria]
MWALSAVKTLVLVLLWMTDFCFVVESTCRKGCPLALASYYVWKNANITFIRQVLGTTENDVLSYNPSVPDDDRLQSSIRVNVPFSCDCVGDEFLGHVFQYKAMKGDTYDVIAGTYYANLTTVSWMKKFNSFDADVIPVNAVVNVPVNCSCGNAAVSKKFGLFLTYPLRPEDTLGSIAQQTNSTPAMLQKYNPDINFGAGSGILFIPAEDKTGQYPRLTPRYDLRA